MPTLELQEDTWAIAQLDAWVDKVRGAGHGNRNKTLSNASAAIGHLTGASRLDRVTAETRLLDAALAAGEERAKSLDTVRRGLDFGETAPLYREAKKTLTEYVYEDETGQPLFKVIKDPDKRFSQKRFEKGEWVWKLLPETRRVLYRLPHVLQGVKNGETIWIVEGEKDVGTLESRGLFATSSPHGAGKWRDEYSAVLRGGSAIIVPDYDIPGLEHALTVRDSLERHGCSALVMLPLEEGQDATDHIESGKTIDEFVEVSGDELELRLAALKTRQQGGIMSLAELMLMDLPEQKWVIDELLAPGVTLLFSVPKGRKSFLCLDLGISVSTGRPMFDKYAVKQGSVLYLALEDSALRLRTRAEKILAGAIPGPLHLYPIDSGPWGNLDEGGDTRIVDWCKSVKDPRLVIIDVFEKVRSKRKGDSVYGTDYAAIRPLGEVAAETGVAIVVVHHTSKADYNPDDPMSAASGSNGLRGSVDNLIFLRKKGDNGSLVLEGRDLTPSEIPLEWDQPSLRWRLSERSPDEMEFEDVVVLLEQWVSLPKSLIAAELHMTHADTAALLSRMQNRGLVCFDERKKTFYLPASPSPGQQSRTDGAAPPSHQLTDPPLSEDGPGVSIQQSL